MNELRKEIEKKHGDKVLPGQRIDIRFNSYEENKYPNSECYRVDISFLSKRVKYVIRNEKTFEEEDVYPDPNNKNIQERNVYVSFAENWCEHKPGVWGCTNDAND